MPPNSPQNSPVILELERWRTCHAPRNEHMRLTHILLPPPTPLTNPQALPQQETRTRGLAHCG